MAKQFATSRHNTVNNNKRVNKPLILFYNQEKQEIVIFKLLLRGKVIKKVHNELDMHVSMFSCNF